MACTSEPGDTDRVRRLVRAYPGIDASGIRKMRWMGNVASILSQLLRQGEVVRITIPQESRRMWYPSDACMRPLPRGYEVEEHPRVYRPLGWATARVREYVKEHPGQKSTDIQRATDTSSTASILNRLRKSGEVIRKDVDYGPLRSRARWYPADWLS